MDLGNAKLDHLIWKLDTAEASEPKQIADEHFPGQLDMFNHAR